MKNYPTSLIRFIFCCWVAMLFTSTAGATAPGPEPVLVETAVFLVVDGVGGKEMPAIISSDSAYLGVSDLFSFLKIKNKTSQNRDSVYGYFLTEKGDFLVNKSQNLIHYQNKDFKLKEEEILQTPSGIYLRTDVYSRVFGLNCSFSFRALAVRLSTNLELPIIREMRLEMMRKNVSRLKGDMVADTFVGPRRPAFKFGMADWSVITTQRQDGPNDVWLNLGLGATVLGGETIVSLNYNNFAQQQRVFTHDSLASKAFDEKQQFVRWRYVNNDSKVVRQVVLGNIYTPTIASIFYPIIGVQVTNTPTTFRRAFGSYTLSDYTEPGWVVELYVNNGLVDYTTADAGGFFTFQVPMVYGNSMVRLRFYGPWGEERFKEQYITVPFNFTPKKELEYVASAGIVEDDRRSRFARAQASYGLANSMTVGGGMEYLSSIADRKGMPFISASARLTPSLILSAEYVPDVIARGILSFRMPANFQLEGYYSNYRKGQQAIIYNYLEERKVVLSKPISGRRFTIFNRLTFDQLVLPGPNYSIAEWLISGAINKLGVNISTYGLTVGSESPFIYSNFAVTYRIPGDVIITPQVQYQYTNSSFIATRLDVGRYIFKHGYLNASYERNFKSEITNVGIGLRYDFSFAQIGFSGWRGTNMNTYVESARGSFVYDGSSKNGSFNNRYSVGTGGIVLIPFLDLNRNGKRDKGEPRVQGLRALCNGGNIIPDSKDTLIRILNLLPYERYYVELNTSSFDNLAWRLSKTSMSIFIDPNQLKAVDVPLLVMGEVSGKVEAPLQTRLTVYIYNEDGTIAGETQTEPDGSFNYLGLAPGNFTARLDVQQLEKLELVPERDKLTFTIKLKTEGDVVNSLVFKLDKK
ncbi:hypothetical protein DVR12_22925 [Chitinophaga silvatica]|uniref:Carboxypeptidase regulatory-like domain-containing protein n=1 Tax=Chitinophaga silvatica TaxID=2282649 RepID=A0A3E1Y493_9BACT|nr:hypothetical protein [Chitinophaga silvatica]RFS19491.1 hypothetical protein DVR12_22925 [Chitinophaga silvatica]